MDSYITEDEKIDYSNKSHRKSQNIKIDLNIAIVLICTLLLLFHLHIAIADQKMDSYITEDEKIDYSNRSHRKSQNIKIDLNIAVVVQFAPCLWNRLRDHRGEQHPDGHSLPANPRLLIPPVLLGLLQGGRPGDLLPLPRCHWGHPGWLAIEECAQKLRRSASPSLSWCYGIELEEKCINLLTFPNCQGFELT